MISQISETLGALNIVGKYLVNVTRNRPSSQPVGLPHDVPGAIYTISKNVLGRNVTDFIREALPSIAPTIPAPITASTSNALGIANGIRNDEPSNNCLTPDGKVGLVHLH